MAVKTQSTSPSTPSSALPLTANGYRAVVPPAGQSLRRRERRRFGLVAGAVVLVLAAALAVGLVVKSTGGKVSVIEVVRSVPAGQTITARDLGTVEISGNIPAYKGTHQSEVIGKIATVGLVKGDVLNPNAVGTRAGTPAGYVIAGVLLKPGQLPAAGVSPGDKVNIIVLSSSSSGSSTGSSTVAPTVLDTGITVTGTGQASDGSGTVVSLQVPKGDAAQLAQANNAGLVTLVQVPAS